MSGKVVLTFEIPTEDLGTFDGGFRVNTADNIEDALFVLARTFKGAATAVTATNWDEPNGETYLTKGECVHE